MKVTIEPSRLCGTIQAPPSKSAAHRALIAAALAEGKSTIRGVALSDDICATIDCLRSLSIPIEIEGDEVTVTGRGIAGLDPIRPLDCRESGSTLRFLIPLCLLSGRRATLTGSERLLSRPLGVYENLFAAHGVLFERGARTLTVEGNLPIGDLTLSGEVSSQFVTGLLLALGATGKPARLHLSGKIESRSYIDLTLDAMRKFGVSARWEDERTLAVPIGGYRPTDLAVEGDYSGAAFFYALAGMGFPVSVTGLDPDSRQGDRVCVDLFRRLAEDCATISVADCPDLAPILMTFGAMRHGVILTDTRRLRIKESDRAVVMAKELQKCGAVVTVEENRVTVRGGDALHPPKTPLSGHNDHRVVMSLAVLLTAFGGTIEGAEAVKKSYPKFFDDLISVGAEVRFEND